MNVNEAWSKLFEKYDILSKIKKEGAFYITANQIKEFKEPRLMAKWDSSENLPSIFKKHNINILPTKEEIQNIMRENNVCNEGQIVRRSGSVYSWLKWIFNLQNI
ncbi:hypothetical protein [Bulleidia sp. zg-1006]|nr:hypothetical protein [Bulleidia sp. zg-1006]QRG86712.1 hypothetical protein JOS54_07695 [Bulleidia sp. zg-1006]